MGALFDQQDVFPIIADVIMRLSKDTDEYVTHTEIVNGLLEDSAGSHEIEEPETFYVGIT